MKENPPAWFPKIPLNPTFIIGLLGWFNLIGCSQNFLYDASRDKMGQAAVKAASEVKLNDTANAFENRFTGLLALEVEA
jgi:hypothetical protein